MFFYCFISLAISKQNENLAQHNKKPPFKSIDTKVVSIQKSRSVMYEETCQPKVSSKSRNQQKITDNSRRSHNQSNTKFARPCSEEIAQQKEYTVLAAIHSEKQINSKISTSEKSKRNLIQPFNKISPPSPPSPPSPQSLFGSVTTSSNSIPSPHVRDGSFNTSISLEIPQSSLKDRFDVNCNKYPSSIDHLTTPQSTLNDSSCLKTIQSEPPLSAFSGGVIALNQKSKGVAINLVPEDEESQRTKQVLQKAIRPPPGLAPPPGFMPDALNVNEGQVNEISLLDQLVLHPAGKSDLLGDILPGMAMSGNSMLPALLSDSQDQIEDDDLLGIVDHGNGESNIGEKPVFDVMKYLNFLDNPVQGETIEFEGGISEAVSNLSGEANNTTSTLNYSSVPTGVPANPWGGARRPRALAYGIEVENNTNSEINEKGNRAQEISDNREIPLLTPAIILGQARSSTDRDSIDLIGKKKDDYLPDASFFSDLLGE